MTALTCRDFIDLLSAHVAAELPAERLATFEAHLAQCPACVDYLQTYKDTVTLAKGAFRPDDSGSGGRAGRAGASDPRSAAEGVIAPSPAEPFTRPRRRESARRDHDRGRAAMLIRPCRRHPTAASHVRGRTTGVSCSGTRTASRQP